MQGNEATDYAVHLTAGSQPVPVNSLLKPQKQDVRYFNAATVINHIDAASNQIKARANVIIDIDTLEKQSLLRLKSAMTRSRKRRLARLISASAQHVILGHREICAHLLYQTALPDEAAEPHWVITNRSEQGACLHSLECRAGLVQVGELVSVAEPGMTRLQSGASHSSKIDATIGVIRWLRDDEKAGITIGVEFLARTVMPVHITRQSSITNRTNAQSYVPQNVDENAIIIACKVHNVVHQTMLLPAYLFQIGDPLIASQGDRTRRVVLNHCLQSNGLFSQYSLSNALPSS